jgi:hypothetical protein
MSRHGFHSFTSDAPTFGIEEDFIDPFFERLPPLRDVTVPAGLRPQAASRLDQRRSSHGAGSGG